MSATHTFCGASSTRMPPPLSGTRRGGAAQSPASLYGVLRVRETATAGEIKAAYRSLAKLLHPDVASAVAPEEFKEINRAYATLSDPAERARYDEVMRRSGFGFGLGFGLGAEGRFRGRRWETDQCW